LGRVLRHRYPYGAFAGIGAWRDAKVRRAMAGGAIDGDHEMNRAHMSAPDRDAEHDEAVMLGREVVI
jgi:hypothetical protein